MGLLRIGDNAPEFNVDGFFQGKVTKYSLAGCKGKWLVLFFYPADFTFICPTEVTGFSKMAQGLRRGKLRSSSAPASIPSTAIARGRQSWAVWNIPCSSDESKTLSRGYGVLDEKEGVALRATFIINPAAVIYYQVVSHVNVGRSVEETLRVLKALRTERLCPSDWQPGEPTGDLGLKY